MQVQKDLRCSLRLEWLEAEVTTESGVRCKCLLKINKCTAAIASIRSRTKVVATNPRPEEADGNKIKARAQSFETTALENHVLKEK